MISVAIAMILVGGGVYLNRYVSRWRFRNDPGIMRFVEPMARVGLVVLTLGFGLLVLGVIASAV